MKSIMKRSLAFVMVLAMLLTLALPVFAADAQLVNDNDPCEHDGTAAVKTEKVEATCKNAGGVWHTCDTCGDVWVTDAEPKTNDHQWSDTPTVVEPTCWTKGYTTNTCDTCGAKKGEYDIKDQYTHDLKDAAHPNGCLVASKDSVADCLVGGELILVCPFADVEGSKCTYVPTPVERPATGHNHEFIVDDYQAPTCYADGYVKMECTNLGCDDAFTAPIAKIGHEWEYQQGVESSCTVKGYDAGWYCTNVWLVKGEDGKIVQMACAAHAKADASSTTVYNGETVIDNGKIVAVADDKNAEALRHDVTAQHDFSVVLTGKVNGEDAYKAPVCKPGSEADGWQWYQCSKCDATHKESIKYGHEKAQGDNGIKVSATCTTQGYTIYNCVNCGNPYYADYTPVEHQYAAAPGSANVIYTFVKDGKTYIGAHTADEAWETVNNSVTLGYVPYMTKDLADATAVELMANGYVPASWTIMVAHECGVKGYYAHYCTLCDANGFLVIDVDHVWDGDPDDLKTLVPTTCEKDGGYYGTCSVPTCGKEYVLSIEEAKVPGYDPETLKAQGHTGKNGFMGMDASLKWIIPTEAKVEATCQATGFQSFTYCNAANCDKNLPSYADRKADTSLVIEIAPHAYYNAQGQAYRPVKVEANCNYNEFKVPACKDCGKLIYEDPTHNEGLTNPAVAVKIPYDFMIEGTEKQNTLDPTKHVWPAEREVIKKPTCAEFGQYAKVVCTVPGCGNEKPNMVDDIDKLDPGAAPQYDKNHVYVNGEKIGNWEITVIPATCLSDGKITAKCAYCAENQTNVHAEVELAILKNNNNHKILGLNGADPYVRDENGNIKTDVLGWPVVDRAKLPAQGTPTVVDDKFTTNEGTCNTGMSGYWHRGYYECADCGEVRGFTVVLDHIVAAGNATCTDSVNCTECGQVVKEQLGHNMVAVGTRYETLNAAGKQDCTVASWDMYKCSRCDYCTESADFWTSEYADKTAMKYVAAKDHAYNVKNATCLVAKVCTVCDEVAAPALGHAPSIGTYTDATCTVLGYTTYACPLGEACDYYANAELKAEYETEIKEIAGAKYAVWVVVDEASGLADHNWETTPYKTLKGDCLTFAVKVYRCDDCEAEYYADDFSDPVGHQYVTVTKPATCTADGYTYQVCSNCYTINGTTVTVKNATTAKELDWAGKPAQTAKETLPALGHGIMVDGEEIKLEMTCVALEAIKAQYELEKIICVRCGEIDPDDYHVMDETNYIEAATCTTEGLSWYRCTVEGCGHRAIEVTKATGHQNVTWKTSKAATCCEAGSKYLFCNDCEAAVKVGESFKSGRQMVVATATNINQTISKVAHTWVLNTAKSTAATVHAPGVNFYDCKSTTHKCPETKSETVDQLVGVVFTAAAANAVAPAGADASVFVNNGLIAYTISIDADNLKVGVINIKVNYKTDKLTYEGFDLGDDAANLFGTLDPNGMCDTVVGTMNGTVSIIANTPFDEAGNYQDAILDAKEEFVTLYFRINADTIVGDPASGAYTTDITIVEASAAPITATSEKDAYKSHIGEKTTIKVSKLGDVNVNKDLGVADNKINSYDVLAVQNIIKARGYDARADIDQNGVVNGFDLIYIKKYIANVYSYADMIASGANRYAI